MTNPPAFSITDLHKKISIFPHWQSVAERVTSSQIQVTQTSPSLLPKSIGYAHFSELALDRISNVRSFFKKKIMYLTGGKFHIHKSTETASKKQEAASVTKAKILKFTSVHPISKRSNRQPLQPQNAKSER